MNKIRLRPTVLFVASLAALNMLVAAPADPAASVKRELAAEGQLFSYVDLEGGWRQLAQDLQATLAGTDLGKKDFVAVTEASGLASIRALGLSSSSTKDGYDNRFFIHTPGGRKGLLAIFPGEPALFDGAQLAPADTDLFVELRLDMPAVVTAVKEIVRAVADSKEEADMAAAAFSAGSFGYGKLIGFKGRVVAAVRLHSPAELDNARKLLAPGLPLDLFFQSTDGGSAVKAHLANDEGWSCEEKGGIAHFTKTQGGMETLVLIEGENVTAGFPKAFVEECRTRKAGLAQAESFKQALACTATKGQAVVYLTPRAFTELRKTAMALAAFTRNPFFNTRSKAKAFNELLSAVETPAKPIASVTVARPDGLLVRSRSTQSFKAALPVIALLTPDFPGQFLKAAAKTYAESTAAKREGEVLHQKISGDLERAHAAAAKYFGANPGVSEVNLVVLRDSMPEDKIPEFPDVTGDIVFSRTSDQIVLDLANGQSLTHVFPLTAEQRRTIETNLRQLSEASAEYLLAGNSYVSASTLVDNGFMEKFEPVVGESYDSLDFSLDTPVLTVRTPGEQEISYTRDSKFVVQARRRHAERQIAIEKNLMRIDEAVKKYLESHGDEMSVSFEKLVEAGLVPDVKPVAGENYAEQFYSMTKEEPYREIRSPRVGSVRLQRPLEASVRADLTRKLTELERLVAQYFAKNPQADVVVSGELLPAAQANPGPGSEKREVPSVEVGDANQPVQKQPDLTALVIRRDCTSIRLELENDQVVEVPRTWK